MRCLNSLIIIVFITLVGCSSNEWKTHESGLEYKFVNQDKMAAMPMIGDIIAIEFRFTNSEDKLIEESDLFRTQLQKPSHLGGSIEDALTIMHKGDSAIFLIKAEDYYTKTRQVRVPEGIKPTEMLKFHIKMVDVMPFDDFEQERQAARISDERFEDKLLEDYIERTNIQVEPTASGMYYIVKEEGSGLAPTPGKKVTVHYMGYFIDGKLFDSSYDRNKPFTFTLGVGEVIFGWDEGISKMKVGGKAQLVIPSSLAYGSKKNGPIPPHSTLVFDVELISVQD